MCILEFRFKALLKLMQILGFRYLEGLSILYSITFVFALPLDLYSFRSYASPEGLGGIRSLIIAFGQTDQFHKGLFRCNGTMLTPGSLDDWEKVLHGLERMKRLHELQILLGHRFGENKRGSSPDLERRPWKNEDENPIMEERHEKLFELLGSVNVPNSTLHLTWNPEDVLCLRQWPFKVNLQTIQNVMQFQYKDLPGDIDPIGYGWM